jgi:hypothetical protein
MNYIDFAALILGTSFVMMVFVVKTNIEKSRVKVQVRIKK